MQEVRFDGTKGEVKTADTLEELIPMIRESLSNPKVKYVKVFNDSGQLKSEEKLKGILDEIAEEQNLKFKKL